MFHNIVRFFGVCAWLIATFVSMYLLMAWEGELPFGRLPFEVKSLQTAVVLLGVLIAVQAMSWSLNNRRIQELEGFSEHSRDEIQKLFSVLRQISLTEAHRILALQARQFVNAAKIMASTYKEKALTGKSELSSETAEEHMRVTRARFRYVQRILRDSGHSIHENPEDYLPEPEEEVSPADETVVDALEVGAKSGDSPGIPAEPELETGPPRVY